MILGMNLINTNISRWKIINKFYTHWHKTKSLLSSENNKYILKKCWNIITMLQLWNKIKWYPYIQPWLSNKQASVTRRIGTKECKLLLIIIERIFILQLENYPPNWKKIVSVEEKYSNRYVNWRYKLKIELEENRK